MTKKDHPSTIDPATLEPRVGTGYPAKFAENCQGREKKTLGKLFDLTQFGVNLTTLPPGQWSSLRHWHEREDEFVYVVSGELVMIDDDGEHVLRAGMCAGFAAGNKNGHHLVNRSDAPGSYLEIGSRSAIEHAEYPDIDLVVDKDENGFRYSNRAGEPLTE